MSRFDNILGIHEQALVLRSQRMDVLSQNLANISTPGYKARDIDFRQVLADSKVPAAKVTHERHVAHLPPRNHDGLVYRVPLNAAADGNTSEAPVEQAQFGQAAAQFEATLHFLEKRVSGIRRALKGE